MNTVPPSTSAATETRHDQPGSAIRPREVILLMCWLLLCGGLMFWRSFRVPYGFDDIAHLHALAAYRSGEISLTTWLLHNHNEHFLPLVRLYFMAATKISGLSSSAMHVLIFLNYIAGAFACAWIFFSLTRSRLGAFLAGTIYAGAGSFAASTVWQPSCAELTIAGTPFLFAIAILVSPYARRRWTEAAVLVLVLIAALGFGSISVAALAIPLYLFLATPDTLSPARRKRMIVLSGSLVAAILLVTKWLMVTHGTRSLQFAVKGIYDGLFLIFATGGRFLLAWTPFAELGLPIDIAASVVGWAVILLTFRWVPKPLRQLLLALWAGSGLLALLIGMGRWKIATNLDLFATDRYHYIFLIPLALQAAAVLDHITRQLLQGASPRRKGIVSVALGCLLLAALVMNHIRLGTEMYWWVVVQHQQEFREAKVLARIVRATAAAQPLHLAEGPIRFPGTLNEHLGFSAIIFTQFPKGVPGVVWTLSETPTTSVDSPFNVPPISEADAAVQNQIFDEWAKKINRPPYTCVIQGKVQDVVSVSSCAEAAQMWPPPLAPVRPFH
ncbi:MAG TPA: hypothetical protein VGG15_01255 [Terriglobales bacterium]